jgi:hypothetical protein
VVLLNLRPLSKQNSRVRPPQYHPAKNNNECCWKQTADAVVTTKLCNMNSEGPRCLSCIQTEVIFKICALDGDHEGEQEEEEEEEEGEED